MPSPGLDGAAGGVTEPGQVDLGSVPGRWVTAIPRSDRATPSGYQVTATASPSAL